jgi:hypothetical protein
MTKNSSKKHRLTPDDLDRYHHVPSSVLEQVTLRESSFLPPGADGVTIGTTVYVRPGFLDQPTLLAHELVHVRQYTELGFIRFLATYIGEYVQNRVRLRSHRSAYLAISLEKQARIETREWIHEQHT